MLNSALSIIHEEHRSLNAVVRGLRYLVLDSLQKGAAPDFGLLRAMVFYLDEFPEKLHHPKEDAYLFARLRARTGEADAVIAELQQHHAESGQRIRDLESALDRLESRADAGIDAFAAAVEGFSRSMLDHMACEERTLIPIARQHLSPEDWVEIGAAFGRNGDPRFDAEADFEYRDLFSRIVKLAPPPIGSGSAKPGKPRLWNPG